MVAVARVHALFHAPARHPTIWRNIFDRSFFRRAAAMEVVVSYVAQPLGHWLTCSVTSNIRMMSVVRGKPGVPMLHVKVRQDPEKTNLID
jgi:hypothetical protein